MIDTQRIRRLVQTLCVFSCELRRMFTHGTFEQNVPQLPDIQDTLLFL
nr:MAG TPA: hypothetical protein [Herelleviridae sp.]